MRRVKVDWRLPGDFIETLRRAHELLAEELSRHNLGTLRMNPGVNTLKAARNFSSGHHHMGTTRMHTDPRQRSGGRQLSGSRHWQSVHCGQLGFSHLQLR
jgi:hypothetical protein